MTPSQALTRVRYLIKESSADFWTDAELYVYMTDAEREVFNLIMEEDEGFFETTDATISYVNGTQEYDLPSGCVKVVLVERTDTDPDKTLHPINIQDKLRYEPATNTTIADGEYEYYYLTGTKIGIVPTPDENATNNLKIYYVATPSTVSASSTAFTIPDAYNAHELICVKTAITAKLKGDEPTTDLERKEAKLEARLKTSLALRQTQEPRYVNYISDAGYDN